MTPTERARRERLDAYIAAELPGQICARCGATLANFDETCSAPLDHPCEGFIKIECCAIDFRRAEGDGK